MALICPKCRSGEIDFQGVLGTEEPRYACLKCGYSGPLVLEAPSPDENAEQGVDEAENQTLCPNCGAVGLKNASHLDANGDREPRYSCGKCGYSGPTALRKDVEQDGQEGFPYTEILVLLLLSVAGYVFGAGVEFSVLFFSVPSAVIVLFRYLLRGSPSYSVEDDLRRLDENGLPKKYKS